MGIIVGNSFTEQRVQNSKINESTKQNEISLRQACQDFESIFIFHLMKNMRQTVPKSYSMLYGGLSEDIYRSMMDEEIARNIARGPGIGLAEILYRQLSRVKKS
ncbi:flagellar biosynthesis protein FlgJ [Candidatus Gottesmanbacteria bacterium]|nr:flagellar biosynthesis protein FlgJ [Candidatus Gottesmanbacteria bacterium]